MPIRINAELFILIVSLSKINADNKLKSFVNVQNITVDSWKDLADNLLKQLSGKLFANIREKNSDNKTYSLNPNTFTDNRNVFADIREDNQNIFTDNTNITADIPKIMLEYSWTVSHVEREGAGAE